jgi:hypothetical protein
LKISIEDFYNEDGYSISYLEERAPEYSIGYSCPLPVWIAGKLEMIAGDRHPSDIDDLLPSPGFDTSALADLRRTLSDARSGVFREQAAKWGAQISLRAFMDVFEERPSASRYWITRFRAAVNSTSTEGVSSKFLKDRLREVGRKWLSLFATKTDLRRISLLLGDCNDGVFSAIDFQETMFAFLLNKLSKSKFDEITEVMKDNNSFIKYFPEGIYFYYLNNGFPNVPFHYEREKDLLKPLKECVSRMSLSLNNVNKNKYKGNFVKWTPGFSRRLAILLFGTRDAPSEVVKITDNLRSRAFRDFQEAISEENYYGRTNVSLAPLRREVIVTPSGRRLDITRVSAATDGVSITKELLEAARTIIDRYDFIRELDGVSYGINRFSDQIDDYLTRYYPYVDSLRQDIPYMAAELKLQSR